MLRSWFKPWKKPQSPEQIRRRIIPDASWGLGVGQYLATPLPHSHDSLSELELVALDFETTGVDSQQDKILSIGMVPLTTEAIDLANSQEIYISHGEFIKPETAAVNGLTPKALVNGVDVERAMDLLFQSISGKVVLVHGACIERAFINAYLQGKGCPSGLPFYMLDTLALEKRYSYRGKSGQHGSYQLDDLRRYYGLPEYGAHSAASDALACAELFLVQFKKLEPLSRLSLADVTLRR